jgi:hypothetical protein
MVTDLTGLEAVRRVGFLAPSVLRDSSNSQRIFAASLAK